MTLQENEVKPTWLYIKQHSVTKLMYFGCTTRVDVVRYGGSGSYWVRHCKKHNRKFVKTLLIIGPYTNKSELKALATFMSEELDIVASDKYANLIIEDGMAYGSSSGHHHGKGISKPGTSAKMKGRKQSKEHIENRQNSRNNNYENLSDEEKVIIQQKQSDVKTQWWNENRPSKEECKIIFGSKNLGQEAWNKGLKTPDEVKQKLREAKLGKPTGRKPTPEHQEKMRQSRIGRKWFYNPETGVKTLIHPSKVQEGFIEGCG